MTPKLSRMALAVLCVLPAAAGAHEQSNDSQWYKQGNATNPTAVPKATTQGENGSVRDENAINTLAGLLAKDAVLRARVGDRIADYIFSKTGDAAYLTAAQAKLKANLAALPRQWVEQRVAAARQGEVAELYFLLGDAQSTAKVPGLAQFPDFHKDFTAELDRELAAYTPNHNPGPYSGQALPKDKATASGQASLGRWWGEFLDSAASNAEKILNKSRIAKKELWAGVVAQTKTDDLVAGAGLGSSRPRAVAPSSAFGVQGIYVDGAETRFFQIPGTDKKPAYRRISIKIYTETVDGHTIDKLAIYDISVPGDRSKRIQPDIYGREFDLKNGDSVFPLRDGEIQYKLAIKNGQVQFGFVDKEKKSKDGFYHPKDTAAEAANGPMTDLTVKGLYDKRQQQAEIAGLSAVVNGQNYRIIGQGGSDGRWVYYPADAAGHVLGDANMTVKVTGVGPDGWSKTYEDPQEMGFVPQGGANKQFYYLVYDSSDRSWQPKRCQDIKKDGGPDGHMPCEFSKPAPPKSDDNKDGDKTDEDKSNGDGSKDDGQTSAGQGGAEEPDAATKKALQQAEALAKKGDKAGAKKLLEKAVAAQEEKNAKKGKGGKGSLTSCTRSNVKAGNAIWEKTSRGKWTIFADSTGKAFFLCANGDQAIWMGDVFMGANFDAKNEFLVIDTAKPEKGTVVSWKYWKGAQYVHDDQQGAQVLSSGGQTFPLEGHELYYVPKSKLNRTAIEDAIKKGEGTDVPLDFLAVARRDMDLARPDKSQTFEVRVRDLNGKSEDIVKRVTWALDYFAPGSPLGQGAYRGEILAFVKSQVALVAKNPNKEVSQEFIFAQGLPAELTDLKPADPIVKGPAGDSLWFDPKTRDLVAK